ncbi:unnamed protein product, partial [marine sediment metagenome]
MKKDLIKLFFELVQIDSESGEEKEFIAYLENLFKNELNAETVIDGYGNLFVKVNGKNTAKTQPILFGVHADTVQPGKDIEPILENGIIRSKGNTILGADNKAGIVELLEAIRSSKSYSPLEIIVSREEEIGTYGSKNLDLTKLKSKEGYVVDGDALDVIVIGGPTYMRITTEITGKAAHAGMEPEKGISSIKAAAHAISMLKEGWIDTESTVNVGVINGGVVTNAVPEKTVVKTECRSLSDKKCREQAELIKEVFTTSARSLGARVEHNVELLMEAVKIEENREFVDIAKMAIKSVGLEPKAKLICGGTDASNYNAKGINTVVIGTGVQKEHTTEEFISVEDMEKGVEIIKMILQEL